MESLDGMKASINRCQVLVESRDPSPFFQLVFRRIWCCPRYKLEIARERELIREGKEMATRKANALAPSNDDMVSDGRHQFVQLRVRTNWVN